MLTFEMMLLCAALLLVPVFLAFQNVLRQRDSMLLQMLLGYTVCYFMKNFYALLNRAVNGIENDGLEMDLIAMLGAICFLVAAEFCLYRLPESCKNQKSALNKRLQVFLLVGAVAMVIEAIAGVLGNQILFIACYLVSVFCIYAVTIQTRSKVEGAKKL